jgi:glycosyltransferase involved in cell wall biosynthesis
VLKIKTRKPYGLSILWLSFTKLDSDLHKSALVNILSALSSENQVSLVAIRSKRPCPNEKNVNTMILPIRYKPFISPILFTAIQFILLPFYLVLRRPDFIVYEPDLHVLSSFPLLFLSKLTKTKLILDIRTTIVEIRGVNGFFRKICFSNSVLTAKKFFDGITIITPLMKEEICSLYGLNPQKVGVWTSGVSTDIFDSAKYTRNNLTNKFRLENKFIVFYHGVFTHTRALKETIQAIGLLATKYPDIVLFLLGSGPSLIELTKLVQQQKLTEHVIIAEPVEHSKVPEYITMCDIGIIPLPNHTYWRNQSPLKLLEYLSMGKVVVLTDIPAHRLVIGDMYCGIFVSSVEPHELARGIEKAYLQRSSLESMGEVGRKLVQREYTWKKVSGDLTAFLSSV